jgi:hypothetical protein
MDSQFYTRQDADMSSINTATKRRLTDLEELPPRDTKRWVVRRKAAVVNGVRDGLLTIEQACERYGLTAEEFLSWQRLIDEHGVRALRVTRLQDYR